MITAKLRTFRCANCNEMINDSMTQCRYCSVPVDPGIASMLAERQDKANQAYSDASFLRNGAVAMFLFFAVGLILTFAYWGFVGIYLVLAVGLIRWQYRFSALLTNDPDFQRARRSKNVALLLVIVATPLVLFFNPFILNAILELGGYATE